MKIKNMNFHFVYSNIYGKGCLWSLFCAKNATFAVSFYLRILYDLPSASGLEQPPSTVRDPHSNSPFADTSAFDRPQSAFRCPQSALALEAR